MMLEGSNSSSALSWVREDLDDCLENIRDNLEAFAEDTDVKDPLRIVQEELERLNLTFLTMEQNGASILTDEMIAVGGHMLHSSQGSTSDSLSALTDAVIVLPSYLDRLQAGHDDLPILLLPTLNELRATYDESLLSEGSLFAPDLDQIIPELSGCEADAVTASQFTSWAKKMRSQYQLALLGWLKEQSKDRLLTPMQDVCRTLYIRLGRNELRRLWWISELVMRGLQDKAIDNDLPLRRLFARLDMTLKAMAEEGEYGPANEVIIALSRALLFQAAQARPGSKATDVLRQRFRLEELIPDREALLRARGAVTGRDAGLFDSIGDAIREELGQVKDTLDMELRTGRIELEQRTHSLTSLQQLSDTLHMLNLPVPAKAVEDLLPALEATDDVSNQDLDSPLLGLAQKLLEVESILDTHIKLLGEPVEAAEGNGHIALSAKEQQRIISQLLDESVNSLHEAQEAFRHRMDGDDDADYQTPIEQIAGALELASQEEVSGLTRKMLRAIDAEFTREDLTTPSGNLDALTDAVAALELYLSGCRDEQANSLRFLEIMHARLDGLPEASADGSQIDSTTIELPQLKQVEPPAKAESPTARTEQPEASADTPVSASVSDVDPAMLEIFIEEFDSVAHRLTEYLPVWIENPDDNRALTELRRGFHTLKGSGRMIGAVEIGDFSWHMEELLNKLFLNKLNLTTGVKQSVALAVASLSEFRLRLLGQQSDLDVDGIRALANFARNLADGNTPLVEELKDGLPESLYGQVVKSGGLALETDLDVEVRLKQEKAPKPAPKTDAPESHADSLSDVYVLDPAMQTLMVAEITQQLVELEVFVKGLMQNRKQPVRKSLVRAIHTLAGNFAMAPLGQEAQLARSLENLLEKRLKKDQPIKPAATRTMQTCLHRFHQRLAILESGVETSYPIDDADLLAELTDLTTPRAAPAETIEEDAPEQSQVSAKEHADSQKPELESDPEQEQSTATESPGTFDLPSTEPAPGTIEVEEGSILSIFLEEATEVLERCDSLLNTWRDKLSDLKLVQNLQREIHTFKGGARMAGLDDLGNLSHAMESLLERIASNRLQATVAAVQALEEGCDRLNGWVEQIHKGRLPDAGQALARFESQVQALSGKASAETIVEEQPSDEQTAEPIVFSPLEEIEKSTPSVQADSGEPAAEESKLSPEPVADKVEPIPSSTPVTRKAPSVPATREFHEVTDRPTATADLSDDQSSQSQIRVAAELMDSLVNYAGEVSIYRSRLEQQLGSVRFNLKEVEATVDRLREQLRKMDIETEAQMMSRYQHASTRGSSEFDPLELDRFSNIQQLSRSLTESISDLQNLQGMMDESVLQAESLLTQQSRVSADLQAGLMQTRMTPFGSAAPRLRRVVRTAAAETGKMARLHLRMAGSSDQLDRNVLERITAPLEHMLRNAIAHGIETPKVRRKLKKEEEGQITVTVEAEATEFVIRVYDDGGGIDLDAVRRRAIERGMLGKSEKADDQRLIDFIRDSGFSTAKSVTGLSGRGVGMDVVNNEIKQIGGSMEIHSEAGKGTRFTIRIPFSLAVMQAIGISVGERPFLIPLNSVAGVARMSPAEYSALAASDSPVYEFAGEQFPLLELEPLLNAPSVPLDRENVSLMMISSGESKGAFRVSGLQGHQEVVIKPIGPQISSIPGILGGTIAADGQVVIILDMGPLIRRGLEQAIAPAVAKPVPKPANQRPLVMVVDDSITMRKVTSRVLEKHSIEVMTAQDGLDAIERLHDRVPDLMLLDIEMPRMDGYELAQHVRSDARLRHVPIVMITSRAGQKHRKKARDSGANAYLTKPYQEADLVSQVGEMLDMELQPRRPD